MVAVLGRAVGPLPELLVAVLQQRAYPMLGPAARGEVVGTREAVSTR